MNIKLQKSGMVTVIISELCLAEWANALLRMIIMQL